MERRSYVKNAAILTAASLALRLAGMWFRIYLAGALGDQGVGLYELVQAFYAVFVTLATAGVSVAATRLLTEELAKGRGEARGMLRLLAGAALALGTLAAAAQWACADLAAALWLGDVRAADAIRAAAPSLPFMAAACVLRGFFLARRSVVPNAVSQLAEQAFRIGVSVFLLYRTAGQEIGVRCAAILAGSTASEVLSALLMLAFYGAEKRRCFGSAAIVAESDVAGSHGCAGDECGAFFKHFFNKSDGVGTEIAAGGEGCEFFFSGGKIFGGVD